MIKLKPACPTFSNMDFSIVDDLVEVLPWFELTEDDHSQIRLLFANPFGELITRKTNRVIYSKHSEVCKQIGSRLKTMDGGGGDGMMRVGEYVRRGDAEFWTMRSVFRHAMLQLEWVTDDGAADLDVNFAEEVSRARGLSTDELSARAADFPESPEWISVTTRRPIRNQYVVALALERANGVCEMCQQPAPFIAKSTGQPYLEVHHVSLLADGGKDIATNTLAVCPNCHRKAHFG